MRRLRRPFSRDRSGTATVEFALLLPILLTMLTAMVEYSHLLMCERKVLAAAQAAVDLVTQAEVMTEADLDTVWTAAQWVTFPYPADTLQMTIANIEFDTDGNPQLYVPLVTYNGGTINDPESLAAGLGAPLDGLVIVRMDYEYQPVLGGLVTGIVPIDKTTMARPRRSRLVEFVP